jgi:hypothetical protein
MIGTSPSSPPDTDEVLILEQPHGRRVRPAPGAHILFRLAADGRLRLLIAPALPLPGRIDIQLWCVTCPERAR